MNRLRRGAAVFGALLVVALGACTSPSTPADPPTMHPGTAPTATPSTNPGNLASTAAMATVETMYMQFNAALRTRRSDVYRRSFTKTCGFCESNAGLIDRLKAKGEQIEGGRFTLTGVRVAYVQPSFLLVEGYLSQQAARITRGGTTVRTYKAAPRFRAIWRIELVRGAYVVTKEDVPG